MSDSNIKEQDNSLLSAGTGGVSEKDVIYRQAAIDMLAAMQGRCTSKVALIQNSKIWQQIKDLPPAQPEIIHCRDCRHNGSFDTDCPIDWNGKEYCSFAERVEDG